MLSLQVPSLDRKSHGSGTVMDLAAEGIIQEPDQLFNSTIPSFLTEQTREKWSVHISPYFKVLDFNGIWDY